MADHERVLTTDLESESESESESEYEALLATKSKKIVLIISILVGILLIVGVILIIVFTVSKSDEQSQNKVYYTIFSHNNYDQPAPLWNATSLYIGWIEVDIFFNETINNITYNGPNDLFVAHDRDEIVLNKTISSMYLDRLRSLIDEYGSLWPDRYTSEPLNLMIDFKTEATSTYHALHNLIENNYSDIVTSWHPTTGKKTQRYINIAISGNRDFDAAVNQQNERFISLDGRLENLLNQTDISSNYELMPMISQRFNSVFLDFNYSVGLLNDNDTKRLQEYISICKQNKQYFRLWSFPKQWLENGTVLDIFPNLMKQISDLDTTKNVFVFNTDYPQNTIQWMKQNGY